MFKYDRPLVWFGAVVVLLLTGYLVWADASRQYRSYQEEFREIVIERFGPERLLDLTPDEIKERLYAFRELSAIPNDDRHVNFKKLISGANEPAPVETDNVYQAV